MTTPFNPMKAVFDETNQIFAEAAPKDPPPQPQSLSASYIDDVISVLLQTHAACCKAVGETKLGQLALPVKLAIVQNEIANLIGSLGSLKLVLILEQEATNGNG